MRSAVEFAKFALTNLVDFPQYSLDETGFVNSVLWVHKVTGLESGPAKLFN